MAEGKTQIEKAKDAPIGVFLVLIAIGSTAGYMMGNEVSRDRVRDAETQYSDMHMIAENLEAESKKKSESIALMKDQLSAKVEELEKQKAELDQLYQENEKAWQEAKTWKDRKGSRVHVPEPAWGLFHKCAKRWEECDWEHATDKQVIYRSGEKHTEIYNRCEVELDMCDRLIDSITDPNKW